MRENRRGVLQVKERLDILLVNKGYSPSREKAKALIMSGIVFVNNQKEEKAGTMVDENSVIEVRGKTLQYVSRGGLKLEKAISEFNIDLSSKICMDVGASTGGFTDCMLQNGACKVYSVDVGYGQLAWTLRNDERVICLEKTNIRYLTHDKVNDVIDFASIDVSFISLSKVLPSLKRFLNKDAYIVALIKPQFEAGREKVGKKGVVRDKSVHLEVINNVLNYAADNNLEIVDLSFSPIKGPEGNIEYLIYMKNKDDNDISKQDIDNYVNKAKDITEEAHSLLD